MHLLRSRSFALLFAGTSVNAIGSWTALVAMWAYAAYDFDVGPGGIAVLALAWAAVASIIGPFAGVPIDRFGPKRVLLTADTAGAVVALGVLLADSYHDLIYFAALMGVVKAFALPAAAALPPRLVDDDDLASANALLGTAADSAIVFGPLVAAGAIALWGFDAAFVVDALTYLVGVCVVAPLRLRPVVGPVRTSLRDELAVGFRLTARSPGLRLIMVVSLAVFLTWSAYVVVEPIYVRDVLERSETVFALLQVAFGVGLVLAGLLVAWLGDRVVTPRALSASVLLSGAAAAVYVGTGSVWVAALGVFLWGVDVAFFAAPARTLLQRHAPPETHGRVLSLHTTLQSWSQLIALPITGALAGVVGVQEAALVFVAVAVVAGGWGMAAAARLVPVAAMSRDAAPGSAPEGVHTGADPATPPVSVH